MREQWPIEWGGRLVGWLADPFPEMFNCSGQWQSAGLPGEEFLAALAATGPEGLPVTVHGVAGVADELPDEEGGFAVKLWGLTDGFSPAGSPGPR